MIRTNARGEVIVPFFRVGAPEYDLAHLLDSLRKAAK
jgi:hypothetical protein